jgi:hypothetical protein
VNSFTQEDIERGAMSLIHAPLTDGPFGVDELSGVFSYDELKKFSHIVLVAVLPKHDQELREQIATDIEAKMPKEVATTYHQRGWNAAVRRALRIVRGKL